jgi:PAS domain S-box-containing protein
MNNSNLSYFSFRNIGLILSVALVYFISAKLGLLFAFEHTNVTPVWPPSGIALASLLVFGKKIMPGIAIGAFITNLATLITNQTCDVSTAIFVSIFISAGNTLEALTGFFLLEKTGSNTNYFEKVTPFLKYTAAVLIMCLASSMIGSISISVAGISSWNEVTTVWLIWFLGDISSILVITPLILVWNDYIRKKWEWNKNMVEAIVLYIITFGISALVFDNDLPKHFVFIKSYLILPLLLWTAFCFELRTTITTMAIAATIAVWGTASKGGPFISDSIAESMLSLQVYISIISICILVLRAAINERKESEIILKKLNEELKESVKKRNEVLDSYQNRINSIFDTLLKYTVMDFSNQIAISEKKDEIDAIATGLNTLGEELANSHNAQLNYAKELEQTNLLLLDSEQQIQSIFNNAPDAIIVIDSESIICKWNPQAELIFGWTSEEVVGEPLYEFIIPTRHKALYIKKIKKFLNNIKPDALNKNFEIEAINKNGFQFPVSITSSQVVMDSRDLFIGFVRNVTEQKRAEKKIKELAAIVESSDDAIISKSLNGTILSWNKGAEKIYGYTAEEAVGKSISIITPPPQMDELIKIPAQLIHEEQLINMEVERIRKDGKKIHVSLTASPIKNIAGTMTAISLISRDISESKKMAADMVRISDELKRSNTELEQFAYVASHDLQEPLRMVTSYLQLLEKRYKDKLDTDANEFIEFAVDGSNRMRTLIQSLLEYSRINRVKPFEWIDVNVLLKDVLGNLRQLIKETGAVIIINELPKIYGDHVLIDQLFQNLIANAIKFRKQNPEITISGKIDNNQCLFSVKDNGIGIQKEYL